MSQIPKIFHFVWIGDESKEPKELINSWKELHPDFEVRVYRNKDLNEGNWKFKDAMMHFYNLGKYCGAADLMRWEMLYEHGGIALDADSLCLNRLPDWLLECGTTACWDNTQVEGQLLSNGFVSAQKNAPIIGDLLKKFEDEGIQYTRWSWSRMKRINLSPWKSVGPKPFTEVALGNKKNRRLELTALPSHFLLPMRNDGKEYANGGPVYAYQFWGTTTEKDLNDKELLHLQEKINDIFSQNSLNNILKYSNLRKIIQSFFN